MIFNGQHRIAAIALANQEVTTWVYSDSPLPRKERLRRKAEEDEERREAEMEAAREEAEREGWLDLEWPS